MVSEVIFALVLAGKREFLVLARREERSVCCQHCKERREVLYVVYIGKWVAQRERERGDDDDDDDDEVVGGVDPLQGSVGTWKSVDNWCIFSTGEA